VLCEFRYGLPGIPRSRVTFAEFAELCTRILPNDTAIDELWKIVESSTKQRHGTILVISPNAGREADRLAKQSTPIEPKALADADVRALTSIDGAVLVDHRAICHSIGVILDGLATDLGDPGRGARFNSALRYLESQRTECVVCIVSEDGDVTLLPKLRPRVKRSLVESAVMQLAKMSVASDVKPRQFAELRNWIDEHRFYLSEEQCAILNTAVDAVEAKQDDTGLKINRPAFAPHPAMNDTFWLPE
jgi:hypothetical protein